MADGPSIEDVLDILIQERNHHFEHFQQLSRTLKVATLAAVGVALLSGVLNIGMFRKLGRLILIPVLVVYVVGLSSVFLGVYQHNEVHRGRMRELERRIAEIVNGPQTQENLLHALRDCGKENPLLRAEVDDRGPWEGYHCAINGGVALVALATVVLFIGLWHAPQDEHQRPDTWASWRRCFVLCCHGASRCMRDLRRRVA